MCSFSPVFEQGLVDWIKVYTLIDAFGGLVPSFAKFTFMFERSFSNEASPAPVECVKSSVKC